MNYFKFGKKYYYKKILLKNNVKKLFNKFYIYWTGKQGLNKILNDVNKNIKLNFETLNYLRNLIDKYFYKIKNRILYSDLVEMINSSWETKVKFSKKVQIKISNLVSLLKKNGSNCVKLNGAGQDGYITLSFDKKIVNINKK